jgi:GMP synthase (glutamine-hydrolysing)
VLGGPMGVYEADKYPHLAQEVACIRDAINQDKPVLGICLGAQLIAAALGSVVQRHTESEIGWYDVSLTEEGKKDPVLGVLAPTEKIFQWHGDTFDIPKNAVWLAKSKACSNQAFRYGNKVYGFQFHLEVDEPMIERWLKIPYNLDQLLGMGNPSLPDDIRAETHQRIAHLKELSRNVFTRYVELFSTKKRTLVLGSGHK